MLFGLGAPPIILDTTFKVFRGGATIFGAVCDILVPRQTSALAERDGRTLVHATLDGGRSMQYSGGHRLRRSHPRRRPTIRDPARSRGDHAAGDHADPDRIAVRQLDPDGHAQRAGAQRLLPGSSAHRHGSRRGDDGRRRLRVLAHFDIVQFLEAYVAVYTCGAIAAVVLMIRGPIRLAHEVLAVPEAARRCSAAKAPRQRSENARAALNAFHNTGVCLIQRLSRCLPRSSGMATSMPRQVAAAI